MTKAIQFLERLPNIRVLILKFLMIVPIEKTPIWFQTKLQVIDLTPCLPYRLGENDVLFLQKNSDTLIQLTLTSSSFTLEKYLSLFSKNVLFSKLKTLRIRNSVDHSFLSFTDFFLYSISQSCPFLESIELSGIFQLVTSKGWDFLKNCPKLKKATFISKWQSEKGSSLSDSTFLWTLRKVLFKGIFSQLPLFDLRNFSPHLNSNLCEVTLPLNLIPFVATNAFPQVRKVILLAPPGKIETKVKDNSHFFIQERIFCHLLYGFPGLTILESIFPFEKIETLKIWEVFMKHLQKNLKLCFQWNAKNSKNPFIREQVHQFTAKCLANQDFTQFTLIETLENKSKGLYQVLFHSTTKTQQNIQF